MKRFRWYRRWCAHRTLVRLVNDKASVELRRQNARATLATHRWTAKDDYEFLDYSFRNRNNWP